MKIPKNDTGYPERRAFQDDRQHRRWKERARLKREQEEFFQTVVFVILILLSMTVMCAIAARLLSE